MTVRNDAGTRFSKPLLVGSRSGTPFLNAPNSLLDIKVNSVLSYDFNRQSECLTASAAAGTPWRSDVIGSPTAQVVGSYSNNDYYGVYRLDAGTVASTGIQVVNDNATTAGGNSYNHVLGKTAGAEFRVKTTTFGSTYGTAFWGVGIRDTSMFSTTGTITSSSGAMMFSIDTAGALKFTVQRAANTNLSATTITTLTADPSDYFTVGWRALPSSTTGGNGPIELWYNGVYQTTVKDVMPSTTSAGYCMYFGVVNTATTGSNTFLLVDYAQTFCER
jgi:hypothetical protein